LKRASIVVTGNCQAQSLAEILEILLPDAGVDVIPLTSLSTVDPVTLRLQIAQAAIWLGNAELQLGILPELRSAFPEKWRPWPALTFDGFHPDMVYAMTEAGVFRGLGDYHSAIALWAWKHGYSAAQARRLYDDDIVRHLGYLNYFEAAQERLANAFATSGLEFSRFWMRLKRLGVFMHTLNHPRLEALELLAKEIARCLGVAEYRLQEPLTRYLTDRLLPAFVWPVYPSIALYLGVVGSYRFRYGALQFASLDEYLEAAWEVYEKTSPSTVQCSRLKDPRYDKVLGAVRV
jgi:hypothetical protein